MAAPSISGGITIIEDCTDFDPLGKLPLNPLSGSTINDADGLLEQYGGGINFSGASGITNGTSNTARQGAMHVLDAPVDLTVARRITFAHFRCPNGVEPLTASVGLMFFLNSGSAGSEEAVFLVAGSADNTSNYICAIININRTTDANVYTGSFDPTDVTHVGIAADYWEGYQTIDFDSFGYVDPVTVINGEVVDKGDFALVTSHIDTNNTRLNESSTANMHHCLFGWGVGDGATETHFSELLKVFEFVRHVDLANAWGRAHINDNDIGFEVNASANDVITFELCNWISDDRFYWNSIGSSAATVNYSTCVIKRAGDLTIVDGHIFDACIFDDCGQLQANNPTLTNCIFNNAPAAALELGDGGGANLTNIIFDSNQTAIIVDVAGNASIDVTECTFNASNTYFIEYTGTGTLTVTANAGIDAGKLNASGGGTINVASPQPTLTINGLINGCEIRIYDDENPDPHNFDTELAGEESLTGTSYNYVHAGAVDNVVIQMIATGYEEAIIRHTLSAQNQTVTVIPRADENL